MEEKNLDRFRFRAWYMPLDGEKPHYVYDIEQIYDGYTNNGISELGWVSSFGSLLNSPEEYIIEQCTGIKDKNGKLIYEGDIIRTRLNRIGEVIWKEICFCYRTLDNTGCTYIMESETEVIGTIHDEKMVKFAIARKRD